MTTKTLHKIYHFLQIIFGVGLGLTSLIYIMGATTYHFSVPAWTAFPTFGMIVVAAITMALGIQALFNEREKGAKAQRTRMDLVEAQTDWMCRSKFSWDCARRVANKHLTPEEWETFYDKMASAEWLGRDVVTLPQTKFDEKSIRRICR